MCLIVSNQSFTLIVDEASVIIRKFLGSATGGQLRFGLVFVVAFIALLNSSGIPVLVAGYIIVFLAIIAALALIGMLLLSIGPNFFKAEDNISTGRDKEPLLIDSEKNKDPQVSSLDQDRQEA